MGMNFSYAPFPEKKDYIALIHKAVEEGITFFDTAQVYEPFTNEELVGRLRGFDIHSDFRNL
jgi:aryl-alcohol dehydrogenase-like predicted oxidoreductase